MRLSVSARGEVVVTAPRLVPKYFAERLVEQKRDWILRQLQKMQTKRPQNADPRLFNYSREQYEKYREKAREFCAKRVAYWATQMDLDYNRIAIKNMKTRWGSCSIKKNLNFNYKIIFLKPEQADYLIVHELAHLRQMNHSPAFWKIVEEYVPNYKKNRIELNKIF